MNFWILLRASWEVSPFGHEFTCCPSIVCELWNMKKWHFNCKLYYSRSLLWAHAFENIALHKFLMFLDAVGRCRSKEAKFYSSVFHLSADQYLWLIYAEFKKRFNVQFFVLSLKSFEHLWFMWKISQKWIWVEMVAANPFLVRLCRKRLNIKWLSQLQSRSHNNISRHIN